MIVADLAITNLCNARCPQCQRTNVNGLGTVDALPSLTWTLEDFKRRFPVRSLNYINQYSFCGTWGDPLMAKDIEGMVKYIIDNSNSSVIITTNGSIRNDEFYWDLGAYCGKRLSMVIDVDGITEEMHQKYRRGTSLKKSLDALQTLSQTKAFPLSQSIIFKHNQDYKDEIEQLASANGSINHSHYNSDRFDSDKFWFVNEDNNKEYLEKAT